MNRTVAATLFYLSIFCMTPAHAQAPVMTSLQANGRVTWTNATSPGAIYRMEWASNAAGPWHAFTIQPMNSIDALGGTSFEAEVPMFYRVVMMTNEMPWGMAWIDAGDVILGASDIAAPVHTNFISGFWMDTAEITKAQWDGVASWAATHGYDLTSSGSTAKAAYHPAVGVSWYECVKWCNARSQMEGLTPCYYTTPALTFHYTNGNLNISNTCVNWNANGYRLPTEAEWEKAARGGRQGHRFPWGGDTIQHVMANYQSRTNESFDTSPTRGYHPLFNETAPCTSPSRVFAANGYGLYDMSGNVWEWCWDWAGDYSASFQKDPPGPMTGSYGVLRIGRGGSWAGNAEHARCAFRGALSPDLDGILDIGFRCVRGR